MKKIRPRYFRCSIAFLALLGVVLSGGCDRHRDLYVHASPLLAIEGDWLPSLGVADMSGRATARLYRADSTVLTEFFDRPDRVTTDVSFGTYGVLIFNGLMFAENKTNLDRIYFRNTERTETFEAVAEGGEPNARLTVAAGEYLANNGMELFTSAWEEIELDAETGYRRKYKNGEECFSDLEADEAVLRMTPRPLSWRAQVLIHLINPDNAAVAVGALRGFTGSVFVQTALPSHLRATHHLTFNNLRRSDDSTGGVQRGTIESPVFVTFGPPTDLSAGDTSWRYEFDLNIILKDGSTFERSFDIGPQVQPLIEKIRNGLWYDPLLQPILIEIGLGELIELPNVESIIGVSPWEDTELIRVRITDTNTQ